jgi:hypothetical protein
MNNRNYEMRKARKVLGVSKSQTAEDVKKKYWELAKIWHPDINSTDEAHAKMRDINKAYALLMKEEFGILDPWEEANRYWWERFGNDPICGNPFFEDEENSEELKKQKILIKES